MHESKLKKLETLLHAFENNEYLSFDEIKTILNCGKTAVHDYLNIIKKRCELKTKKINGQKYYHAVLDDGLSKYKKLTEQDVTLFDTLIATQYFSKHILDTNNLYKRTSKDDYVRLIDYSLSTFYYNHKLLIEKGLLYQEPDTKRIYVKEADEYSVTLNYSDLKKYAIKLNEIAPTNRYYTQLCSIKSKINPYIGDINDDTFNNNYYAYGKDSSLFNQETDNFRKYDHINFSNYAVEITYKDKDNNILTITLYTGFITYVEEKNTIYIVGEEKGNDEYYPIIIADSIISIVQTNLKNTRYFDVEFKKIYTEMFSISTGKPFEVEVEFDHVFGILNKVKRLSEKRKHTSKVICINQKIIYRDTIRGLQDFAVFLRRFGRSCKVIKPVELIQLMDTSINRSLTRYEQLKESEEHE